MRTVQLTDGEIAPIYVEPGYSTLLRFDAHPESGLIGDQDSFKVEYLRNMVAIKPLVSRGNTNLFIFTKEGQFGFQLIAGNGRHDNNVYVKRSVDRQVAVNPLGKTEQRSVLIDDLITKKINRTTAHQGVKLSLLSIATPASKSTLVIKFSIQQTAVINKKMTKIERQQIVFRQGSRQIPIENLYLETSQALPNTFVTEGLALIRRSEIKAGETLRVILLPHQSQPKPSRELQIDFSPELSQH